MADRETVFRLVKTASHNDYSNSQFIAIVNIIKFPVLCYRACFCIRRFSCQRNVSIFNCDLLNSIKLSSLLNIKACQQHNNLLPFVSENPSLQKVPDMSCALADTLQRQDVNSIRSTSTISELQKSLFFSVHRVSRRKLEKHMRGIIRTVCRPSQHTVKMWRQRTFIYNMTNPEKVIQILQTVLPSFALVLVHK